MRRCGCACLHASVALRLQHELEELHKVNGDLRRQLEEHGASMVCARKQPRALHPTVHEAVNAHAVARARAQGDLHALRARAGALADDVRRLSMESTARESDAVRALRARIAHARGVALCALTCVRRGVVRPQMRMRTAVSERDAEIARLQSAVRVRARGCFAGRMSCVLRARAAAQGAGRNRRRSERRCYRCCDGEARAAHPCCDCTGTYSRSRACGEQGCSSCGDCSSSACNGACGCGGGAAVVKKKSGVVV